MRLFYLPDWFAWSVLVLLAAGALWKGDWRLQLIVGTRITLWPIATAVCDRWVCWGPDRPPWMILRLPLMHGVLLAVCLICLIGARRYWVLWANSFALLMWLIGAMALVGLGVSDWARGSGIIVCGLAQSAVLAWGIWTEAREKSAARGPADRRAASPQLGQAAW